MLSLEHLADLAQQFRPALSAEISPFQIGSHPRLFGRQPAIMGVINLSPDSWYRESVCLSVEAAIRRGRQLHAQGADLIDLGAESTLTHADRVSAKQQWLRLQPIVETLASDGVLVSVETYHPEVAECSLRAGAKVLNLTGTEHLPEMFRMAAQHEAAVILCHVQGANVREVGDYDFGDGTLAPLLEGFAVSVKEAQACGLNRLFLDPGLGFYYRNLTDSARRVQFQAQTFLHTFRLRALGYPICHALPHAFEFFGEEVRSAEPFFAVLAALGRTDLFRTHEVPKVKAVLDTLAVIHP